MESELPAGLPPEAVSVYSRYLAMPMPSPEKLMRMVERHLDTVQRASGGNEFLDLGLAERLADGLLRMLEEPGQHLAHVQAAVRYFVEADDAEPDLESMLGFDDDAQVYNAVCRHLGRPQWQVEL